MRLRRLFAAALAAPLLMLSGCLVSSASDGLLLCSDVPGRACPMGFYCEPVTNSCWRDGDIPDLVGYSDDMMFPFHQFQPDLAIPDMSIPLDMSLPPPDLTPTSD